jgi:polyisoprenoid-binding protein YceI
MMKWCRANLRSRLASVTCLGVIVLGLAFPLAAQQVQVKLDPAKTHIDWILGDVLHTVQGNFRLKTGTILFDPRTGEASGKVVVDATSGNSGNSRRDSKMQKEVLESARYPEITFAPKHVSGFVAGQVSQTVQVSGSLTIHGGSHDLTLALPISVKNTTIEGHTNFSVPYEAWGMKNPSTLFLKVSDTVQISVSTAGDLQLPASAQVAR